MIIRKMITSKMENMIKQVKILNLQKLKIPSKKMKKYNLNYYLIHFQRNRLNILKIQRNSMIKNSLIKTFKMVTIIQPILPQIKTNLKKVLKKVVVKIIKIVKYYLYVI